MKWRYYQTLQEFIEENVYAQLYWGTFNVALFLLTVHTEEGSVVYERTIGHIEREAERAGADAALVECPGRKRAAMGDDGGGSGVARVDALKMERLHTHHEFEEMHKQVAERHGRSERFEAFLNTVAATLQAHIGEADSLLCRWISGGAVAGDRAPMYEKVFDDGVVRSIKEVVRDVHPEVDVVNECVVPYALLLWAPKHDTILAVVVGKKERRDVVLERRHALIVALSVYEADIEVLRSLRSLTRRLQSARRREGSLLHAWLHGGEVAAPSMDAVNHMVAAPSMDTVNQMVAHFSSELVERVGAECAEAPLLRLYGLLLISHHVFVPHQEMGLRERFKNLLEMPAREVPPVVSESGSVTEEMLLDTELTRSDDESVLLEVITAEKVEDRIAALFTDEKENVVAFRAHRQDESGVLLRRTTLLVLLKENAQVEEEVVRLYAKVLVAANGGGMGCAEPHFFQDVSCERSAFQPWRNQVQEWQLMHEGRSRYTTFTVPIHAGQHWMLLAFHADRGGYVVVRSEK